GLRCNLRLQRPAGDGGDPRHAGSGALGAGRRVSGGLRRHAAQRQLPAAAELGAAGLAGRRHAAGAQGAGADRGRAGPLGMPAGEPDRALDLNAGLAEPAQPAAVRSPVSAGSTGLRTGGVSTRRKQLPPPATRTYSSAAWFASLICLARYRPSPVPYSWVV